MIVRRSANNPTRTFDIAKNYISKSIQNISLKLKTEDGERGKKTPYNYILDEITQLEEIINDLPPAERTHMEKQKNKIAKELSKLQRGK